MKKQYIQPATDTHTFDIKEMVLVTGSTEGLDTNNTPVNNVGGDAKEITTTGGSSIWGDEEE